MRSTRDFLTGILAGVAIGILTAPRSGKETRDKLTEEANKRTEDLKGQWEKGVAQAKEGYEQAKTQVSQYADKAKDQYDQYAEKAKDQYSQYKGEAKEAIADAKADGGQVKAEYNQKVDELADDATAAIDRNKDAVKVS